MDNPDEHVHPYEAEVIEVLSGEYGVAIEGTDYILTAGDEITVPMNTAHRHWNPTDQPIRVAHEHHPAARESEAIFETLYALAQAGRTDEKGFPNLLQFAVINKAYPGHAYRADLPISVQSYSLHYLHRSDDWQATKRRIRGTISRTSGNFSDHRPPHSGDGAFPVSGD